MSTIANSLTPASASAASTTASTTAASTDPLASESTFLTLLVSQLQNQDPLDPVDSNQFVSQLTEYSQLEQLLGIHTDTTAISQAVTTNSTAAASTPATDPASVLPDITTKDASQTNSNLGATN
jgi:flagellar basal-body rod modification protein FlgD